jgi:hypothetical protein
LPDLQSSTSPDRSSDGWRIRSLSGSPFSAITSHPAGR